MMNFSTLTGAKTVSGSIMSWMNYGKLDAVGVLEEAQAMIYARLRCREMKSADVFPVRAGISELDVPDGFLDPIMVKDITNDCKIKLKDETELEDYKSWSDGVLSDGDPAYYAIVDEQFNFDCKTRTAWQMRVVFYKQPDYLALSNPTNFLTKRYPHLLRMACLATGARFNDDESRFEREQKLLFLEIDELSVQDEMSRSTDAAVEM